MLEKIVDIDLSNEAFGFSEYKEFKIKDTVPVRAMRLGFVGELSYELHVPSSYMNSVWLMINEAGKEFNIMNFGVEAQNVLRMESHKPRFDLQDRDLIAKQPFDISLPQTPGSSVFGNGILANRMNHTQVSLYNMAGEDNSTISNEPGITDVTEATLFVALIGPNIFSICEKLTALDFMDPAKTAPFLFQGPFSHVPCQIVTLDTEGDNGGLVMTCSRGYGQDMIHSILQAGEEFGLKPAGENRFTAWINGL